MKKNFSILRGQLWFLLFVLLTVAAQKTQAQGSENLTLLDKGANAVAISGAVGSERNVTLDGRTLYRDGDWNTLCLPFGMTSDQIASSPLAGATIKELYESFSSLDGDGNLTLTFKNADFIDAGKPYIVKWGADLIIKNDADWDVFVGKVAGGTTYEGKIVKLAADINIGSGDLVGNNSYPFKGTFDGCGHTINCAIENDASLGVAPFFYINGATIKNLKVTGTVQAANNHCAGLVGYATGTCTIQNCWVATDVNCTGGAYCGGVLGHAQTSVTTISNCLYSGEITGNGSTAVGVISGWSDNGGNTTINNCLADGTYTSTGTVELIRGNGTKTTNSCIKRSDETAEALVSTLGSEWKVSGNNAVPDISGNVTNPTFNNVTISNAKNDVFFNIDGGNFWFKGNYDQLEIGESNRSKILLLSSGNRLGYVKTTNNLNAFRAYFEIENSTLVRSFRLDFGDYESQITGIINVQRSSFNDQSTPATYDLQGRRVSGESSMDNGWLKKGIYIRNGRKVIIK